MKKCTRLPSAAVVIFAFRTNQPYPDLHSMFMATPSPIICSTLVISEKKKKTIGALPGAKLLKLFGLILNSIVNGLNLGAHELI